MPSAKKVSWAQLRIGIMASFSMVILGSLIFLLTGSGDLFTSNATLYTYMDDSAAMAASTTVRLNGIPIGKIDTIALTGLKEKGKIVIIKMKVKRKMLDQIPEDSLAGVDAANLLGDKFLNVLKGKSQIPIKDGGTLKSVEGGDIPELVKHAGDMLGTLQTIINRFDALLGDIENGKGNVGKFIKDEALYDDIAASAKELNKIVNLISSGKGIVGHLLNDEVFYQEFRSPIKRMDAMLNDLQQGQGTAGKILKDPALYNDARETIADMRRLINVDFKKLVDDLNAGKGTAGKLLKDEELYRRMNQLVANLETSLDKVNSGQGTLGQLLVNGQLYESLNGATREAQDLIKAIHANPKKFLRIKLGLF
jgi:phospholipid/cholesterol/gamma-HCH transport system substrate-binding protein